MYDKSTRGFHENVQSRGRAVARRDRRSECVYARAMRFLRLTDGGTESALDTFERDHVAICRVADSGGAELRIWRAKRDRVSLGRFHRRAAGAEQIVRRLSGGRASVVGPGFLGITIVVPSPGWLDPGRSALGPDRVLNRALRPLLAALRAAGVDPFYGGRDLVTWEHRPIATASFTVLPDSVLVVEASLALSSPLQLCTTLLSRHDPGGVVLHDATAFDGAPPIASRLPSLARTDWAAALAASAESSYDCSVLTGLWPPRADEAPAVLPAFDALQAERAPLGDGWSSAFGIEMLGAVEVAARIVDGRIADLEISGDLIAPFETLEEIAEACRGEVPAAATAERAILTVLSRPGRFVLGARDLAALFERLG